MAMVWFILATRKTTVRNQLPGNSGFHLSPPHQFDEFTLMPLPVPVILRMSVQHDSCRGRFQKMHEVDAAHLLEEEDQVISLRKSGQPRQAVQPHINDSPDPGFPDEAKKPFGALPREIAGNDSKAGKLRSALAEAERLRVAATRFECLIRATRFRRDGRDGAALAKQERAERKWLVASEMDPVRLVREGRVREAEERAAEQWRCLASIRDRGDAARKEELPVGARDRLRGMWHDRPGR